MSQSLIYFALGTVDDWAVMFIIGTFFVMLISFLYDLVRVVLNDNVKALGAAAMMAVLPVFFMSDGTAYSGYADTPLSFMFLVSFGVTLLWKKNRKDNYLLLAAALSGLLFLTKNEGVNLILLNLALMVLPESFSFSWKEALRIVRAAAIFLAIVALISAPWLMLVRNIVLIPGDANDIFQIRPSDLAATARAVPEIALYTARAFIGTQKNMMGQGFLWAAFWFIFAATSVISYAKKLPLPAILSLICLLNFIIISLGFMVYLRTTDMTAAAVDSAMVGNFFRLYLAIGPVAAFQIVATIKALEGGNGK